MPIKYAEITIIINTEKETMINYFSRLLLGHENSTTDNDTIIILFDDGIICDVKKEYNTKLHNHIKMGFATSLSRYLLLPTYFEIEEINETFFYKMPRLDCNGELRLDCKPIFANNKKHITTTKEASIYNSIFEIGNNEVLSILKIKSSKEKPRFLLAYDDEYFKKEYIIGFVNYIFSITL